jgi:hypothetical protein
MFAIGPSKDISPLLMLAPAKAGDHDLIAGVVPDEHPYLTVIEQVAGSLRSLCSHSSSPAAIASFSYWSLMTWRSPSHPFCLIGLGDHRQNILPQTKSVPALRQEPGNW